MSLLVAQNLKAHAIAESLVLPAAKILVRNLLGEEAATKFDNVSLSIDTVKCRIQEVSVDIHEQVIARVKVPKFGLGIQLDESTDAARVAICLFMSATYKLIQ